MRKIFSGVAVALASLTLTGGPANAAPIDDARAALAQKEYAKVDTILAADLKAKAPSADALRVSMDAAEASGRVVTAAHRATALLKLVGEKDPELLFRAARVAELSGDPRAALVRYLGYARQVTAKSDAAEQAFTYIFKYELYPEEYKKYVGLFGADSRSALLGHDLLGRLVNAIDAERSLDLAAFLIQSFPDADNVYAVHSALRNAADAYVFGKEKDRYVRPLMVMARGEPNSLAHLEFVLQQSAAGLNEESRARLLIDLMSRYKRPLSVGMLQQLGADLRAIKSDDAKLALAKQYLAHEAAYAAATDADSAYYYLRQIGESPQVFNLKDRSLVSGDDYVKRFEALKARSPAQPASRLTENVQWTIGGYVTDQPGRIAFLRKNLAYVDRDRLGDLGSMEGKGWEALVAEWSKGKPYGTTLDARVQQVRFYGSEKNKAGLTAVTREYIAAHPGNFSAGHVREHFIGSPLLDDKEKLAVLQEAIDKAGYGNSMRELLEGMVQDKPKWQKVPELIAMKAAFDKKPAGSDLLMRTQVALTGPVGKPDPAAQLKTAADFIAQYKGAIPGGDEKVTDVNGLLVQQIFMAHAELTSKSATGTAAWADAWAPRMPLGTNWRVLASHVRDRNGIAGVTKLVPVYTALAKADKAGNDPDVWTQFIATQIKTAPAASPYTDSYALISTDVALSWLFNMRDVWGAKRQYVVDEMAKVVNVPGAKITDPALARALAENLQTWGSAPNFKVQPALIKAMHEAYVADAKKTGKYHAGLEASFYGLWLNTGKDHEKEAAAHLAAWLEMLKQRPIEQQAHAFGQMFHTAMPPAEPAGAEPTPGFRRYVLFKVAKPVYEKLPPRLREQASLSANFFGDIAAAATAAAPADPKVDPKADAKTYPQRVEAWKANRAEGIAFARTALDLLAAGAKFDGGPNQAYGLADIVAREALADGDMPALNRALSIYADYFVGEGNMEQGWQTASRMVQALDEKKADEPLYAFLTSIQKRAKLPDAVAKPLMLARAKAGTQIGGIIPVGPEDPLYDLYVAARDLAIGDEQHAWELTNPKLKVLLANWPAMDPSYVAWSVDQLRKQRLLKDGLAFAFQILLSESELDADVAARVLLAKGDIYKDMENYPAARIEYEGLRTNNRYNKTEPGGKAVYRLVDLAIVTKDYSAAEQLLERLVDADTVQKQADAYYLYAKMAFQRGDFKESRDYLKKVKERVLNHVETALLEGELNLVLPGGLQNTEVAIGDPRLSTAVIPGRQLTLTLQDRNLSIARGGAAIPVVVTCQKSGDVEHIKLLPSSSNKNLFSARISTALGAAAKDDLTLQLRGDDVVSYQIEPEFQKANDLNYEPKRLDVRYDARLVASSGEILSEEEQEKREMERQLQMRQAAVSRRFEVGRDGRTIRPGSKIFVQITDFGQDLTDEPDKVKVDLKTGLGDTLEGVELTETGPHTGIFRGAVPTGLPLPRATASDSDAGKSPNTITQANPSATWSSLADGRKGKWVEVDTMSSNEVAAFSAVVPGVDQVKDVTVLGMLADDYEELASFPERAAAVRGGLVTEVANDQKGETIDQMRRHIKLASTESVPQDGPAFDRDLTSAKGKDGWLTTRTKGSFYIPENRALDLKWVTPYTPAAANLRSRLLIDGVEVLTGLSASSAAIAHRVELPKGVHTYELLVRDISKSSKVAVGYRTDAGTYEPIPADWFSIKAHPELDEFLKPKGKLTTKDGVLALQLDQPRRLRKIRVVFNDFLGTAVSMKSASIKDAAGKSIVPVPADASANAEVKSALPVSPGDTIVVSYNNTRRLREESKVLASTLNSSYFNGKIVMAEELITGTAEEKKTTYLEAKRCRPGDQLAILVTDYDEDLTEKRDQVPLTITTSAGEKLTLSALETADANVTDPELPVHSGTFLAILKIGNQTTKDTIKASANDTITVSYVDKENTIPGIPIERKYTASVAAGGKPEFLVYRTRVNMVPDESPEAKARLKRILGKDVKGANVYKPQVIARHPDYVPPPAPTKAGANVPPPAPPQAPRPPGGPIVATVSAPLLFEVNYPERVLNSGSVLELTAVAESELKAAAAEKREPKSVKLPTYVMGIDKLAQVKGYPIRLESALRKDERTMLTDGAFAGVLRLQIGSVGDPVDDLVVGGEREFSRGAPPTAGEDQSFYYKVPTLLVLGSDAVHIQLKDDKGQVTETVVRLLSDARLELLDPTYTVENASIHLGERFHVRVTDPDHDTTNERDTVKVKVKASSGSEVVMDLTETLPHSGVFSATLTPTFVGEKGAAPAAAPAKDPAAAKKPAAADAPVEPVGPTLYATFGDEVTFEYVDDLPLESASPVTVTQLGRVLSGADAQVAVFTKKFKDPEIAVKTRFLMAEALFETAKEHRKLNEVDKANEEIARGKRVLEEAIRDYPNTSLAAQGDYLLANLAQELTNYQEAVARYSNVIGSFPDSEYAAQSQFKKALCFEKLQSYDQSCEEYVKLTYIYPDSPLVADATVRLGNYYYKNKSFKIAGKIFYNFQQKNPTHKLAPEALFLSAQCYYKLNDFKECSHHFQKVIDEYVDDKNVRPEAMYWLADAEVKANDNVKAYRAFKKLTWDYPETEWAKRARGRLTEEAFSRMAEEQ